MPNDNKLAQLVAPAIGEIRQLLPQVMIGENAAMRKVKEVLMSLESQVQADLIEKEIAPPATELSVLLDLLAVAAERRNATDVKHYREQILKVARQ